MELVMIVQTAQQFTLSGRDHFYVEADRLFTIQVEFRLPRKKVPIVMSSPCLNSLGYERTSPQTVLCHFVGIAPAVVAIDFDLNCVADITVVERVD